MNGPDERWDSLPKWARDAYARALTDGGLYETRLRAMEATPDPVAGAISHSNLLRPWRGIPGGDTVRLFLDDSRYIDVRVKDGQLLVSGNGGVDQLVVLPAGGVNVIRLEVRPL